MRTLTLPSADDRLPFVGRVTCTKIQLNISHACGSGGMADAQVSDACESNFMWVRLPSPAPEKGFVFAKPFSMK